MSQNMNEKKSTWIVIEWSFVCKCAAAFRLYYIKKSKENPVFITLVHQHLKKNSNNKIKIIWLCLFWQNFFFFACLLVPEAELYRKTSHSYDAESNALWCPAFFSPLCEIFCAQLLNNTWKHMKWKKK